MTTNLRDQSPAIAAAIRKAFRSSDPCHCHGDGKLSETEVLFALADQGAIRAVDVDREDWLPIEGMFRYGHSSFDRAMEHQGIRYFHELTAWTYADLLALPEVGPAMADKIEAQMAKFGLLLRDGSPNRLAEAEEQMPTPAMSVIDGSPYEIRQACAKAISKLAMQLLNDGTSLLRQAARVTAGHTAGPTLRRFIKRRAPGHEQVARIVAPLSDLERRELELSSRPTEKRTGRRRDADRPAIVREGKVIRGAFGDGRAA